jgi:hypothetical protein
MYALRHGVLGTACSAALVLGLAASCSAPAAEPAASSEQDVSIIRQAQIATRVFRKLVGRDPTPAEIRDLRTATLGEMVDTVLSLPDFQNDGFFAFQRDRLLLHRDGDENWRKASVKDYCALKLDMADVARADAEGAGYYEILRYRDRWVGLTQATLGAPVACLTQTVGDMKRAMNVPGAPAGAASQQARACGTALMPRAAFKSELGALPATANGTALLASEPGKKLVLELLKERLFKPANGGAAPAIELVTDEAGRPRLRAFEGPPNDRCETADALAGAVIPATDGIGYLQVRVPPVMEGVHGSMYWLSRHPSSQKNRELHRARAVFFSYLCTEISPAMAAVGGGEAQEIEALKPYFDPADEHVKSSANCYNCHTQVQPIANYFGELTKGIDYAAPPAGGVSPVNTSGSHFHRGDGFRRPGGLWKGDAFFASGAGKFGMEGLADLFSNLDVAHQCVARNAWSTLIGEGYPLTDRERAAAVEAFKGDGTFRFSKLLRHLAVESPRGRAFFEGGEAALAQVQPPVAEDCRDAPSVPPDAADAHETLLVGSCAACHSGTSNRAFYERVGGTSVFKPERLVGPGLRYSHLAEFYNTAYCRVWSDNMPIGGWNTADGVSAEAKKKKALCFLGGRRNEAARASEDPAIRALEAAPCAGQEPPPPSRDPHPVQP